NAAVAQEEKREATYQAYRARLAAAVAALANHDVADAARHLKDAPEELHGWEWRHLSSRLDDSSAVGRLRPGDPAFLLSRPEGVRVGTITGNGLRFRDENGRKFLVRFRDENGRKFPERPFPPLAGEVFTLAGPATGWLLAVTQNNRVVRLWDQTGRVVGTIKP